MKMLCDAGANPGALDKLDHSTIILAAKNGHLHVLFYLLKMVLILMPWIQAIIMRLHMLLLTVGMSVLHSCCRKEGLIPTQIFVWNTSILEISIKRGQSKIFSILLAYKAIGINFCNNEGKTLILILFRNALGL